MYVCGVGVSPVAAMCGSSVICSSLPSKASMLALIWVNSDFIAWSSVPFTADRETQTNTDRDEETETEGREVRGDASVHVLIDKPAKKAADPHTFKHTLLFKLSFSFYDSNIFHFLSYFEASFAPFFL